MTRSPHDQFAKQYIAELLALLGEVQIAREVAPEVRQVDLWFTPASQAPAARQVLGLLGKMTTSVCLIEPYRNPVTVMEVRNCLLKLLSLQADTQRKAKREQTSLAEIDLPRLWIISPTCSQNLLEAFEAKPDEANPAWLPGVYFLPQAMKTAIVAIHQLPITEETLWLRLLGRKNTQLQAINELKSLEEGHPLKKNVLELLTNWRITLETSQNVNEEDRELIMNLSPAYLRWREDTLQEGKQEGKQEGRQEVVENLLRIRFGSIDEELSGIIEPLLQLPPEDFTRLLLTLSRNELLQRFK